MKTLKKLACTCIAVVGLTAGSTAYAGGIPVIDIASIAKQVAVWTAQYGQMVEQFNQMKKEFDSLNGSRGMANLVNDPASRKYLPADYQSILSSGYGNSASIRSSAKVYGLEETTLDTGSDLGKAFESNAKQGAINRATAEDAYKKASERFDAIQVLLDKVNDAPDAKDVADLQARIQAEQVMMQNEQTKLQMLAQLASAQRDLQEQKAKEISLKQYSKPGNTSW